MPHQLDTNECIKRLTEMLMLRDRKVKAGGMEQRYRLQAAYEMEALGCAIATMTEVQKLVQSGHVETVKPGEPQIIVEGNVKVNGR